MLPGQAAEDLERHMRWLWWGSPSWVGAGFADTAPLADPSLALSWAHRCPHARQPQPPVPPSGACTRPGGGWQCRLVGRQAAGGWLKGQATCGRTMARATAAAGWVLVLAIEMAPNRNPVN